VTGLIATLAAAAVIISVMLIGWRVKPPPPDPNWKEHVRPGWKMTGHLQPAGAIAQPRWYRPVWLARYPLILLCVLAAAIGLRHLVIWLFVVFAVISLLLPAIRAVQVRGEVRRRATRSARST
jgi:hypothetical protein